MLTNRLYRAVKEKLDAQAVYEAACFTGNYTPARSLPHNSPLVLRLREANVELNNAMEEARTIIEAPSESHRRVAVRIAGERDIARYLLQSLAEQGFTLGGNDGEESVGWSDSWNGLYAILFDTDEFILQVTRTQDGQTIHGGIHLIYGNSPEEMISNHTITKFIIPTQEYIKAFYDPSYIIDKGE